MILTDSNDKKRKKEKNNVVDEEKRSLKMCCSRQRKQSPSPLIPKSVCLSPVFQPTSTLYPQRGHVMLHPVHLQCSVCQRQCISFRSLYQVQAKSMEPDSLIFTRKIYITVQTLRQPLPPPSPLVTFLVNQQSQYHEHKWSWLEWRS